MTTLHFEDVSFSMLKSCSHSLVELSLTILYSDDDDGTEDRFNVYSAVSKVVEEMLHLKKLELETFSGATFRIKSKSLGSQKKLLWQNAVFLH